MIRPRAHRDTPWDLLVVGLGNPGERYARTRHNVGADTAELLAARHGERFRNDNRCSARVAELRLDGRRVAVATPTTWMNESGRSVAQLVKRYPIEEWADLVVVHDELDLPPGRVKVKVGGGLAGHNGLRSLEQHLHTREFTRVRIGVGKPPGGAAKGADWVLSKVPAAARAELDVACEVAADAVESILLEGIDATMQRVNAG
ncbi:MAG TPA: aminoacyl-tRNA hydrolase [Microthrixaceae bacterium]|nr:aminoacyl-tRNA hydrolase [Microthrixaceae bacterium]